MSKLSIEAEIESDKYDIAKTVTCYSCEGDEVDMTEPIVSLYIFMEILLRCYQL